MGNCCISSRAHNKAKGAISKGNVQLDIDLSDREARTRNPKMKTLQETPPYRPQNITAPNEIHKQNGETSTKFDNYQTPQSSVGPNTRTKQSDSNRKLAFNEQIAEALFLKYKDANSDCILTTGTEKLCEDLKLDPTEFRVLLLAWKFNVSQMCRFTRKEFMHGCRSLQVDSTDSLLAKLNKIEKDCTNLEHFRDLYRFTYSFGLDVEEGQKTLPAQLAIDLWKLVFTKNTPAFLDEWFSFLEDKDVKGISKDTWNMFLYLHETIEPDFSNYDDCEAWPSLFDEFVAKKRSSNHNNQENGDIGP
eukprot:gene8878-9828_t